MYKIDLPLHLIVNKSGKKYPLNLNYYRNAHHRTNAKAKIFFHDLVRPKLRNIPELGKIKLEYYVYKGSQEEFDISNICSIVDKFFSDTLVSAKIITDDNFNLLPEIKFCYGGYDKENPRVEAHIIPLDQPDETTSTTQKDNNMQIIIVEAEIKQAISDFIQTQISINDDMVITVDLKATRGDAGMQAVIDIVPYSEEPVPAPKATKTASADAKPRGRPRKEAVAVVRKNTDETLPDAPENVVEETPVIAQEAQEAASEAAVEEALEQEAEPEAEPEAEAPRSSLLDAIEQDDAEAVEPAAPVKSLFGN